MAFLTDQQTIDDLNLFGKSGGDSIYQIFNRTKTRGGAAILEEMFRFPLSDETKINHRSRIIQYLAKTGTSFPFSVDNFDPVETYIKNTDTRTKLSAQESSIAKKFSNLVALDAVTSGVYLGITALIKLLNELNQFLNSLDMGSLDFYQQDKADIMSLLTTSGIRESLNLPLNTKISSDEYVAYDEFFRFKHRDAVLKILNYVYGLDVYFSIAKVAVERDFIFPKALPKQQHVVKLEGVYHPQVKNAVANSIHITPDSNVIFLTGANMAGKSTFMKSLSVALFLAHMGFPVAAKEMEFSVLDGIYTTINLPDNLGLGVSHFYVEVLRAKKIAQELKLGRNLFVLFDEMFRGTNVKDAAEATIAFTEAFAGKRDSMFVISTHIIEAGEILKERCDNINFVYLPTRMDGNQPVYTYTLEQGLTADRHGMIIIKNEGILDILASGMERMNKQKI
ncbi:DNA mismatch repair protein [Sphingobacterium olei]|uniref:DNA mismatch repair protein n=1 Tax=Sphingobacterium olei TaxID=2571155 RepID=A0A4U0P3T6_9SPHI|nr:DNA mismatch repair protein [Sphingobacterium olei]TJZ61282.1 DNA mismatch repair protein [Sphingobacterium olei]